MSSTKPLLQLRQFLSLRGGEPVFAPLDLDLHAGEAIWLTGPNGAGKTSLLRSLLGLAECEYEGFEFDGQQLPGAWPWLRQHTAWVGHEPAMKAEFTLAENLHFDLGLRGAQPICSVAAALQKVGLPGFGELRAGTLSAGQRRRAALARLALRPARLWLLDEPLANLDTESATLLAGWMAEFVAAGGALMLTGHGQLPAVLPVRRCALELPTWN
ncbi:MAG: heme ABC exporter ATP-binding protein CcmA [Lysobacterales bacterium]